MTQDVIKGLTDKQLEQAIIWANAEQKFRTQKRKQETIATIKALAAEAGVSVAFEGMRGRPKRTEQSKRL